MDDAPAVGRVEGARRLDREVHGLRQRDRTALDEALHGLARAQLHHDERAALVLLDVVDDADVRVVERGGEARLALEAREHGRIRRQRGRQELERDVAIEVQVVGAIHDSHPAGAELRLDPVARDGLADHRVSMIAAGRSGWLAA